MKKTICLTLTLLFVAALFGSCGKQESIDTSGVLEVGYAAGELPEWMNHTNEIPYSQKKIVDETLVGDTQTVRFMGQEYEIEYAESVVFGTRDYTLRYYSIKGSDEELDKRHIVLSEDGTVVGARRPTGLPVEYTAEDFASSERMREIIETAFGNEIDFADYDQCTVTPSTSVYDSWDEDPNRFYSFFWYHSAGESRLSDSTKIVVSFKNGVTVLWMLNRLHVDFSAFDQTIAYEDYTALIEAKLDRIYNRDGRLTGYQIWDSVVIVLNGKYYLDCSIFVKYKLTDDLSISDSCELLIPLQK